MIKNTDFSDNKSDNKKENTEVPDSDTKSSGVKNISPQENIENYSLQKEIKLKRSLLILAVIGVISSVTAAYFLRKNNASQNLDQNTEKTQEVKVEKEPETDANIELTATPIETASTPVPTTARGLITPSSTLTPTPEVVINDNFSCGTYGGSEYPSYPATGLSPLFVSLFPSGGTMEGVSLVGFQWDYDGDGVWDSGTVDGRASHTYTTSGEYTPKFRVVGSNGEYGPTCTYPHAVVVGTAVDYENDTISVDKLYTEVTVSKSEQNFSFSGKEKALNDDNDRIYIPFLTVSSKEKLTTVRHEGTPYPGYGCYESGRTLQPGTAYHQNLFIDRDKPNGTYRGEFTITYTTDNGTVTKDAATARYAITLTD